MKKLPDGELEIMQAIWACNKEGKDNVSRAEIESKLLPDKKLAETTLLTILSRLSDKGFINITKVGRGSVYSALVKEADYLIFCSNDFFLRMCKKDLSIFANTLCNSSLSDEDIKELRKLLKQGR
mgnify:CR=1 FL=1